jgi:hypothetical protein
MHPESQPIRAGGELLAILDELRQRGIIARVPA